MLTVRQRYRQTDRQIDGRTTYDSNTALALRASRGKNGLTETRRHNRRTKTKMVHVIRTEDSGIPNQATHWELKGYKRKPGRPMINWTVIVKRNLKKTWTSPGRKRRNLRLTGQNGVNAWPNAYNRARAAGTRKLITKNSATSWKSSTVQISAITSSFAKYGYGSWTVEVYNSLVAIYVCRLLIGLFNTSLLIHYGLQSRFMQLNVIVHSEKTKRGLRVPSTIMKI